MWNRVCGFLKETGNRMSGFLNEMENLMGGVRVEVGYHLSGALVPLAPSVSPRTDNVQDVAVRVLRIALSGGMTYLGSRYMLHSLAMASGVATPVALALTALYVAYVQ